MVFFATAITDGGLALFSSECARPKIRFFWRHENLTLHLAFTALFFSSGQWSAPTVSPELVLST